MVRLRLRRVGGKAQPSFRIVAAEHEHPRDGRFIEELGAYNPRTNPATIVVDEPKIFKWLKNGAQPSDSVAQILKSSGTLDRYARFKTGEAAEMLAAEAASAAQTRNLNPRTTDAAAVRKDRPAKKKAKKD
ncbi:MAG: 30S ribosomal protein S16 [Anaerolineales bacterium]|nr:30S ribosomal protein S16 [Anaerolineales bacterium]